MEKEERILFEKYCENGDIENIIKVCTTKQTTDTDIKQLEKIYEFGFLLACAYNQLTVVKFFVNELKINVHARNETGFHWACANGNKDIVLYLLSLTDEQYIDVHTEDEYAFRYACLRGHTDIVDILLTLKNNRKIKYRALDDFGFIWACRTKTMPIIQLLLEKYYEDKIDVFKVPSIQKQIFSRQVFDYLKNHNYTEMTFDELINKNKIDPIYKKTQEHCIISYDDIDDLYVVCNKNDTHVVKLEIYKQLKNRYCPICRTNPFKEIVYKQIKQINEREELHSSSSGN